MNGQGNDAKHIDHGGGAGLTGTALARSESGGRWQRLWAESARDWDLSRGAVAAIFLLPFLVVLGGLLSALLGKEAYKWFTGEDRFAETLQVLAFGLGCLLSFGLAARHRTEPPRGMALIHLVIGAGLFFVTGEEVSWGQRIFDWQTPEELAALNRQGETNIHNLRSIEVLFNWMQFAAGAWGTLLPLALLQWRERVPRRDLVMRLIPPPLLTSYFVFPLIWRAYRNLAPPPTTYRFFFAEWSEVMELTLALGIMFFLYFQWRHGRRGTGRPSKGEHVPVERAVPGAYAGSGGMSDALGAPRRTSTASIWAQITATA